MCLLSVIIPIYNGEKYLKKCLDSVCNQTLRDIEIICIDDGSKDNTLSILKKYKQKDKRFKIISIENHGQGHARNLALNEAKGEYIAFVDADDWIELDAYELLYSRAKYQDLDLLFFQMVNYMDDTKNFVETDLYNHICFSENNFEENFVFNSETTQSFLFEIPVCPVSKIYKRSFLDENNLRFPEGILFEDNAFFYKSYFYCNKAGFLRRHLYYRRRHDNSVTQMMDRTKFDIVPATNKLLNVFIDSNNYDTYKSSVINHTFSMIWEWFNKSPLELKQEFYEVIKKEFKGFNILKIDFKNNLNDDFLLKYKLIDDNKYYLDFLSKYKLETTEYVIFDDGVEYELNTADYLEYKSNLKSNNYKISIIIPIYNNEKYISRTLMSIENQTFGFENIEVLMVDDSSNDGTYDIIKKYSQKYGGFRAIHIKNGTGSPGTPRNIGLLESTADYVLFLDHDDLLEMDALKLLYSHIKSYNSDIVYGTYSSIDGGIPTKIIYPNEKHGYFKSFTENERSIAFPPPSIWTKLFRKDFLVKNKILFPTILGEDAIFISKSLINAEGIIYLWDSLICYHVLDEKSHTHNVDYNYLMEGFISEEYLYNFFNDVGNPNLYRIRGEGILDFYLDQFYKSNLNENDILGIFPILYLFVNRLNKLGLCPHVYNHNKILFKFIVNHDLSSILEFKNKNRVQSRNIELKNKLKKRIKKIYYQIWD